jgi:plastocyanin
MNRSYSILLICIVGAAIMCAGCTTQTSSGVTPLPTTIPSTTVLPIDTTMQSPATIVTTAVIPTQSTPGSPPPMESVTPTTAPGGPSASLTTEKEARVRVTANNFAFDRSTITVPAGSRVIVEFVNEDRVGHNMAFYSSPSLSTILYKGEIISGPRSITYSFIAPAIPGIYYFRCDPHPNMDGQFIVT